MRSIGMIVVLGGLAVGFAMLGFSKPVAKPISPAVSTAPKPSADQGNPVSTPTSVTTAANESASEKGIAMKKATFGAGCFWGVESTFRKVPGVIDTAVGFAGGHTENPSYKQVCTNQTGHAEVVEVQYDPSKVSYEKLLDVFWTSHDPTQVNRQGPDFGSQYRTVIFYHDDEQKAVAEASKQKLDDSGKLGRPIATEIVPAGPFYRAEEYHQRYLEKNGLENCHF